MVRKSRNIHGGYKGGKSSPSASHRGGSKRPPLTHFLCIPLVTCISRPQLEASLAKFRDIIDAENATNATSTIPSSAIRPIGTIHLTLGVMSLTAEMKIAEAVEFLRSLDLAALFNQVWTAAATKDECQSPKGGPLRVSLKSLHSMHPPENTSVLFAAPWNDDVLLYPLCEAICKLFKDAGFVMDDGRELMLHATVLNTIYAKSEMRNQEPASVSGSSVVVADVTSKEPSTRDWPVVSKPIPSQGRSKGRGSIRVSAVELIEKCEDFVWADEFPLEKLAICKMGAKKITDADDNITGEEYEEVASIPMPT